jgi:hypothetical protein
LLSASLGFCFSGDDSALDLSDFIDRAGDLAGDFSNLFDEDDGGLRLLFIFIGDFFVGDIFALFAEIFLVPAMRMKIQSANLHKRLKNRTKRIFRVRDD